jgi:hypothetical protein
MVPASGEPLPLYCTSSAEPPMKSIQRLKPLVKAEPMAPIEIRIEKMIA